MAETLLDGKISKNAVRSVMAKLGEIGGPGQDKDFEQAFSNLAHAYAREKCPMLEPYEVGFEVLERSDDGKRAAGITGYQVGDQLMYAPVFWLQGKIKGHELLYLKDQDLFTPCKENWINYMLERKLPEIGETVARDPLRLGIRRPDILRQTRSGLKYAAADMFQQMQAPPPAMNPMNPMAGPEAAVMPQAQDNALSPMPETPGGMPPGPEAQLGAQSPMGGSPLGAPQPPMPMGGMPDMMPEQAPMFTNGIANQQPQMPAPTDTVTPHAMSRDPMASEQTSDDGGDAEGLDIGSGAQMLGGDGMPEPAHKMAMFRKMASLGDRQAVSLPQFIRYVGKRAFDEFGKIYQVAPGIAKMAMDIHGQELLDALKFAETYDLPSPAQYTKVAYQLRRQLNRTEPVLTISENLKVVDKRASEKNSRVVDENLGTTLFNPTKTGVYDIVFSFGKIEKCLVSINARDDYGDRNSAIVMTMRDSGPQDWRTVRSLDRVWACRDYGMGEWTKFADGRSKAENLDTVGGARVLVVVRNGEAVGPFQIGKVLGETEGQTVYDTGGIELVVDNGQSRYIRMLQKRLYVPANAAAISCVNYSEDMIFGDPAQVSREAFAGFKKMSAHRDGHFLTIATPMNRRTVKLGREALGLLMVGYGLSEPDAQNIIKRATDSLNPVKLHIKLGDNAYLATNQRLGPMDEVPFDVGSYDMQSGESVPEVERQYVNSPVDIPPVYNRPADKAHYVTPSSETSFQIAQNAGQQGQQQAFDAGVMTSMLRNMRDDQLIDRFIPALSRAMDASGRLLYQFYWHQEDFAERYGDKDMPDLGDSLRNIFEGLGDIVLKLKQKTVDPYPEEQNLGVNLTDLAGAS